MPTSLLTINDTLPVTLLVPDSGNGAGIVLVHEIFGVSAYMLQRALDL